jgi:hypothetical protein
MSIVEIEPRSIWLAFKPVVSLLARLKVSSPQVDCDESATRARRTFILEMMETHPEAFQNEFDCQTMMGFYPSQL